MKLKDCLITRPPHQRSVSCLFTERTDTFKSSSLWSRWREAAALLGSCGQPPRSQDSSEKFRWVAGVEPDSEQDSTFPFICHPARPPQVVARLLERD